MRSIMWFREDLRIHDNKALYAACQQSPEVIGLFFLQKIFWAQHKMAACRVEFMLRGLCVLSQSLAELNIPLIIISLDNQTDLISELNTLLTKVQADAVFFNKQYEVNEVHRDQQVIANLNAQGKRCFIFDDAVIVPPGCVKTQQGTPFLVFTAYKKAWYRIAMAHKNQLVLPALKPQKPLSIMSSQVPSELNEFKSVIDPALWPSGEKVALRRLQRFIKLSMTEYEKQRDFPSIDGTSRLSPFLATGMISPRLCLEKAIMFNRGEWETGNKGIVTWISELIWRDFYKHIIVSTPRVSMGRAYKPETEALRWQFDSHKYTAWQEGQTGFPLIDAAMRQLNQIGWMHNRLRMVVAMFFSKNLFFDWRLGESYFIQHLIDGDLAANNGGWQWSASTGTDSAPYFRIFNPIRQSERFDPEGNFIRRYCPELASLNNKAIHDPYGRAPLLAAALSYPRPIVDLDVTRKAAILAFKAL